MWGFLGLTFFKESTENSGTVWYDDINVEFIEDTKATDNNNGQLPTRTELIGNYPNPFNPNTTFVFTIYEASNVKINILNMRGQKVATVVDRNFQPGEHKIVWSADSELSSGVYYYELRAGNYRQVKKMVLMR